ncbi:DUF4406 domain-containing protein [Bordetella sp. 2513F-2]
MKIYLADPMTGSNINHAAFHAAAARLRDAGLGMPVWLFDVDAAGAAVLRRFP